MDMISSIPVLRRSGSGRRAGPLVLLVVVLLLAGCKQNMLQPLLPLSQSRTTLERWTDQELTPWLVREVSQHPRFQGQRLAVVQMSGAEVAPATNVLVAGIREKINRALLTIPGGQLVWQASAPPKNNNGRKPLQCNRSPDIHYLIGIETRQNDNRQLTVSVRILDLADQSWVGGFSRSWSGPLTTSQLQALNRTRTDESLRGRRVLPFQVDQADFAARELAWQLSCRLLEQEQSPTRIFLRSDPGDPFTLTTFRLLEKYLNDYGETTITGSSAQAELILSAELQPIHQQLGQFWVTARDNEGSLRPGVNARVYVRLPPTPGASGPAVAESRSDSAPPASTTASPSVAAPTPKSPASWAAGSDTAGFVRILVPPRPQQCDSASPWRRGALRLTVDSTATPGRCFALELEVPAGHQAFLLKKRYDGSLIRLAPDHCRGLVRFNGRRFRDQYLLEGESVTDTLRFPSRRLPGRRAALWNRQTEEIYYALALRPGRQSRELQRHLTRLPGACQESRQKSLSSVQQQHWLQQFDRLTRRQPGLIWQAIPVAGTTDARPAVNGRNSDYQPTVSER